MPFVITLSGRLLPVGNKIVLLIIAPTAFKNTNQKLIFKKIKLKQIRNLLTNLQSVQNVVKNF